MRILAIIIAMLFTVGCSGVDMPPVQDNGRFTVERFEVVPKGWSSYAIIYTDHDTGCKYLETQDGLTSMPHTCTEGEVNGKK